MFKVMTWNVENLFRPGAASGPASEAVFEQKLQGLASIIDAQSPDALAVQEVGDPAALDDLVDRLSGDWHRSVSSHPDRRGIRVAWPTRSAIVAAEEIAAFPPGLAAVQSDDEGGSEAAMGRGALAVTVQHAGGGFRRGNATHGAHTVGGSGAYTVGFAENVSGCAYSATLGSTDGSTVPAGRVTVTDLGGIVGVQTYGPDGNAADLPFHLIVAC